MITYRKYGEREKRRTGRGKGGDKSVFGQNETMRKFLKTC
jgi:hypothetical protein